jgi:L-iditol 2-dehydrogenase
MKALVINKPGELQVKDLPTPAIGADEVLVRMRAVGICHSDYELYSGKYIIPIDYPVIPGHEWSGEVVETGKAVSGLKPGDPVVGECVIESGEEVDHFGFSINGAYSQLFKARPEWLHKLPEGVSFKTGALVEPFTCGYYAIEANGRTNGSETVIVSGGGNIGLCAAAAAWGMGARVILVDPLPLRRAAAEKIGVDVTVDPSAGDAVAKVLELTGGKGADLVIEASGHDSSLAAVLDYVRTGGRVTFVGISIGRKIPVELGKIQGKSLTIKGTIGSPGVWPAAMRFLARTKLNLSPIQTHFFDLTKGIEAFEFGKNPNECIKVTLTNEA